MVARLDKLTWTDLAAWWGAAIGTLVLLWDIFKWMNQGPRLRLKVQTDMHLMSPRTDGRAVSSPNAYVMLIVVNLGDRPTTITHVLGRHYSGVARRLLRRPKAQFIATPMNTSGGYAILPHVLGPGEQWTVLLQQPDLKVMHSEGGAVLCGIVHSGSRRELIRRLRFRGGTA